MGLRITPYDPRVILRGSIPKNGKFSHFFQTVISGTLIELSEVCKCSKYSSESQLSDDTQHMGLRITPCDPRVILRGLFWGCVILMMEMILGGDSYEKSCWKWSRRYNVTTARSMGNHHVILGVTLGVILRVVYVILTTELVLEGESYEKICWKWCQSYSGTLDCVWDMTMVILGVIKG